MSKNPLNSAGNEDHKDQPIAGFSIADLLTLPESQRQIVKWLLRQRGATVAEVATQNNQSIESAQTLLDLLVDRGFIQSLEVEGERRYRPRLAHKRTRQLPRNVWDNL